MEDIDRRNLDRLSDAQHELQKAIFDYFGERFVTVPRPYYAMATAFDDNNAWVNGQGNFSLGNAGRDDASADPASLYAKGDVFLTIPIQSIWMGAGAATLGRTSAGIYTFTITAAAATQIVVVPLVGLFRKFAGTVGVTSNPHGVKFLDLAFGYTVATAAETTISAAFTSEVQTNAVARAANVNPFGSSVTYENPIGTSAASLPVATQATPYVVRAIPSTPAFVNVDNTQVNAELSFVNPGTAVGVLTFLNWHLSVALY